MREKEDKPGVATPDKSDSSDSVLSKLVNNPNDKTLKQIIRTAVKKRKDNHNMGDYTQ